MMRRFSSRLAVTALSRAPLSIPRLYTYRIAASPTVSSRLLHSSRVQADASKTKEPANKTDPLHKTDDPLSKSSEESKPEEKDQETDREKKEDTQEKEDTQGKEQEQEQEKKEDLPPPPPHGDKTPWEVFRETMQSEFQRSKEWNESTKALASSAHDFTESESVRRAREAYEKSTNVVSTATSTVVKTTATTIAKGATWTWDTPVVKGARKAANATGEVLDKATKPIRDTEAYQNVKHVIDDGSSSRYGGWLEKEERRKRREEAARQRALAAGGRDPLEVAQEDPNAGTNVVVHKDAAWRQAWQQFRDNSPVMQKLVDMNRSYHDSDNPLVTTARSITDRIAGFFAENEQAQVIKAFRAMDPAFRFEPFLNELRDYILPEVLDAYVKGDTETLKVWLSEAQYAVYEAITKQYLEAGLKSDGRILDIRNIDVLKARLLDPGEVPVFIITCRTQEVHVYRHKESGKLAAGMEDKVQQVTYVIGITRIPDDVQNPETRGWRLIEMHKSGRDWI